MKIQRILNYFIAGFFAFIFLNILCIIYYLNPVHITTETGVTDYFWEKSAYYSKMTEGYGYGRMNNEGFNNLNDYNNQRIEILLMGTSHMEGTNVPQNKTTAAVLNKLFTNSKYVYNIGISGHEFPHIINNVETAIQFYSPKEYVIIEIMDVRFDLLSLEQCINSDLQRLPSYDSKFVFYLQKIPYLRLIYSQFKFHEDLVKRDENSKENTTIANADRYSHALESAIKKLSRISNEHGLNIIVFYHPQLHLNFDGTIQGITDIEYLLLLKKYCAANNVFFINMFETFKKEYETIHKLPHGFSNTALGIGHLNVYGHEIIAKKLFEVINNIEEKGTGI